MPGEPPNINHNRNIWAPWRMEYIESLSKEGDDDGCFLCRDRDQSDCDQENLVLWRGRHCFAVLNRYPYAGGHSMVAPMRHVADLSELPDEALLEMMRMANALQKAMTRALGAHGFNVGINIGRCAGAGLPGHVHLHVVPRWRGDTNFMPVLGDVHVIPTSLAKIYQHLRAAAADLELSWASGG